MWVSGYGSLMWDGWERPLGGTRVDGAALADYRRSFNKESVKNWGTSNSPAPTLGLEPTPGANCIGTAFEFPEEQSTTVTTLLRTREGASFALVERLVRLPDRREIQALTPVNDRNHSTYIGNMPIEQRAALARTAAGTCGTCIDYVRNIQHKLDSLGIVDAEVREFLALIDP